MVRAHKPDNGTFMPRPSTTQGVPPQPASTPPTLRVAQVIGSFRGGGAQRIAWNLAVGLNEHAVSHAIALKENGLPDQTDPHQPDPLEARASIVRCRRGSPLDLIRAARALRSHIASLKLDLIHVHGSATLPLVDLATRAMRARPAIVFTWHDSSEVLGGPFLKRRLIRASIRRCARVLGSSRDVAHRLSSAADVDAQVFANGGPIRDPATPDPTPTPTPPPTIVWAGRFVPPKDPQALIRAAATLHNEGLDLRVVLLGDALPHMRWFYDQTQELIDSLGVREIIETPGWVDDPHEILARCDIACQTSHTEGLSLALLEQMMGGLAIVATDVGDTATAIEDGHSALLIQPQDDARLVDALRSLVVDADRCRTLGHAARQRAIEHFSTPAMARRALALYEQVLA